mgnify:CR=1 FL=1
MTPIGIDTSVIIGLLDSRDLWHPAAIHLQQAIQTAGWEPVYFDCALAEAIGTIARRLREKGREVEVPGLLDRLRVDFPPETITWIMPHVPRLYASVLELVRSSAGALNFNDGLIALVCREQSIPALASFDRDFDGVAWLRRVAAPADIEIAHAAERPGDL